MKEGERERERKRASPSRSYVSGDGTFIYLLYFSIRKSDFLSSIK